MSKTPIPRDKGHFQFLAAEPPAHIPDGYMAPLDKRTTAEMIADRQEWLASTEQCPTCAGRGRIPKS